MSLLRTLKLFFGQKCTLLFRKNRQKLQSNKMNSTDNILYMEFITALEVRMRMDLPSSVQEQLEFQEYTIKKEHDSASKDRKKKKISLTDQYVQAFNKLTKSEKIDLYKTRINILNKLINRSLIRPYEHPPKVIDVYVRGATLRSWKQKIINVNEREICFTLSKDGKTKTHSLRNYIYRKSKNTQYFSFVLEAVNSKPDGKYNSMHLGFSNLNQFNIVYQEVKEAVEYGIAMSYANELGLDLSQTQLIVKNPSAMHSPGKQQFRQNNQNVKLNQINQNGKTKQVGLVAKIIEQSVQLKSLEEINNTEGSNRVAIIQQLLPNYQIAQLFSEQNMVILESTTNHKLLQNSQNKKQFKLFITVNSDLTKVFSCLQNVQDLKKLNTQIEQITVKNIIKSQNTAVIYMKLKNYSPIYRGRDFLFVRHVFRSEDKVYIVDKSIQNIDYPPFMTIVRGSFIAVWCLSPNKQGGQTILGLDITIDHEGILNQQQNMNLSLRFLSQFAQINKYITKKQSKGQQFSFHLFTTDWNVQLPNYMIGTENSTTKQTVVIKNQLPEYQKKQSLKDNDQQEKGESQFISKKQQKAWTPQLDKQGKSIILWDCLKAKYKTSPWKDSLRYDEDFREHHIWKGEWKHDDENGGLWYKDQVKMSAQKKVLGYVVKKMGSNLIQGKGILNISLPVDIFSTESNLQRVARTFVYAPLILQNTANMQDPVAQLKQVIILSLTHSLLYMSMQKPFNPVLGQTFQGSINGCPIYLQQTSHHPPIVSFYFVGRGYKIYGSLQSKMTIGINKGTGVNQGNIVVHFDNGNIIKFRTPSGQISGLTYGDRKLNLIDKAYYWSPNKDLFLQVLYNPNKKGFLSFGKQKTPMDYFEGIIKKVKKQFIQKFQGEKDKSSPSDKEVLQQYSKVEGVWTKQVIIDGRTIFNIEKQKYLQFDCESNPLPSDANYREDIVYRRLGNIPKSQDEKQQIEVRQRKDRQLRQKFRKMS